MKTEYVGYGPDVDAAWDVIANDSKSSHPVRQQTA